MRIYVSTTKDGNMSSKYSEDGVTNRNKFLSDNELDNSVYLNAVNKNIIFDTNVNHEYLRNEITDCTFVNADAIITTGEIFAYCLFGDCIPMIIYDREKNIMSLIHLGWYSVDNNLHFKVLNYLKENYDCIFNDLDIYIGPSIKKESYVLPKDRDIKQLNREEWEKYVYDKGDCYSIDLVQYIIDGLKQMNINNIHLDLVDTYSSDLYFSHHKSYMENIPDGRFIYGGKNEKRLNYVREDNRNRR